MAHASSNIRLVHAAGRKNDCARCEARHTAICSVLHGDEFAALEDALLTIDRTPGQTLFAEDEAATHVFSVSSGVVACFKLTADGQRQIVSFAYPGDFLGLAADGRYAYGAEAIAPARVCKLRRRDMEELQARFPQLDRKMLEMAQAELAAAQERMLLLGRKGARERVASFLLGQARRQGRSLDVEIEVWLPMTRGDVADYLGLTLETVSRVFSAFKREGLALPHGHDLKLPAPGKLAAIADGAE